jgi:hypothetical protein
MLTNFVHCMEERGDVNYQSLSSTHSRDYFIFKSGNICRRNVFGFDDVLLFEARVI